MRAVGVPFPQTVTIDLWQHSTKQKRGLIVQVLYKISPYFVELIVTKQMTYSGPLNNLKLIIIIFTINQ